MGAKLGLLGEKLSVARDDEVNSVKGILNKGGLVTDEGWVHGIRRDGPKEGGKRDWSRKECWSKLGGNHELSCG